MKICRFCQHSQESGDYCEACNAPFSADKLDFSDAGEAQPDPTQQIGGGVTPVVPVAGPEASKDTTAPKEEPAPVKQDYTPDRSDDDEDEYEDEDDDEEILPDSADLTTKKIMYSAKEAGESVYSGKKLFFSVSDRATTQNSSHSPKKSTASAAKASAPAASGSGSSPSYNGARYGSEYTFALVSFIFNLIAAILTCGTGIFGLALSIVAFTKAGKLKKGTDPNPAASAKKVKILATIGDVLNALWLFIVLFAMFTL
ncbi:MAG: hypothetical protein J5752_02690 [Clostridiales bacterium]|nr:hypothetical protein [Clostridiales bacterium]